MSLAEEIEKQVESVEAVSSAEVVVCLQNTSENYTDLDLIWAALFGITTLAYKIWSPHVFDPNWILVNVLFAGFCGFAISRWVGLRRLLMSSGRVNKSVKRAAYAHFHARGVHQTRERTGILVFVSRYERKIVLVPDSGIEARLSQQLWTGWAEKFGSASSERELLESLKAQMEAFQGPFRRQSPRRDDDIDELSNQMVEAV